MGLRLIFKPLSMTVPSKTVLQPNFLDLELNHSVLRLIPKLLPQPLPKLQWNLPKLQWIPPKHRLRLLHLLYLLLLLRPLHTQQLPIQFPDPEMTIKAIPVEFVFAHEFVYNCFNLCLQHTKRTKMPCLQPGIQWLPYMYYLISVRSMELNEFLIYNHIALQ